MILAKNTIVLIDTQDHSDHVVVPGIIRYYNPSYEAYEVNVLWPVDSSLPNMVHWWSVRPSEIAKVIGTARKDSIYSLRVGKK
jgi:hypothetical protein